MDQKQKFGWKFPDNGNYFEYSDKMIDDKIFYMSQNPLHKDLNEENMLNCLKKASIIHKLTREKGRNMLKSGTKYTDIVRTVEESILNFNKIPFVNYFQNVDKYSNGIAFPVGLSVNNIVAHDTAIFDDDRVLNQNDVVKLDIGVVYDGYIIDSAFTYVVDKTDDMYDPLLEASADSMYSAIAMAGPDVRLYEMSEIIQEIIESYQVDKGNGNIVNISAVNGIGGHNIKRGNVHGGKFILSRPHECQENMKMEEGELYAIETYASTGYGEVTHTGHITHYKLNDDQNLNKMLNNIIRTDKSGVANWIKNRKELPFSSSWFPRTNVDLKKVPHVIKELVDRNIVTAFPPLTDSLTSKTAQFEHTIYIRERGVDILSLGEDY